MVTAETPYGSERTVTAVVDGWRHSPTAVLSSYLPVGVNSVVAYYRGPAVDVRFRGEVRVRMKVTVQG